MLVGISGPSALAADRRFLRADGHTRRSESGIGQVGKDCHRRVTEIFGVTGEPPALAVNVVGEMLTTGPAAAVIMSVSESETPEPLAALTVTVSLAP